MVPYREKGEGSEGSPEKTQQSLPSKLARCSHRQRGTGKGRAQGETGFG